MSFSSTVGIIGYGLVLMTKAVTRSPPVSGFKLVPVLILLARILAGCS